MRNRLFGGVVFFGGSENLFMGFGLMKVCRCSERYIKKLYEIRGYIIDARNVIVSKPFFLYRKKLINKVDLLDKAIDAIDIEVSFLRKG